MYDPITEPCHSHHRLAKRNVEVPGFSQETVYVAALLRMAQLVNGNNVRGDVRTALNGSLEGSVSSLETVDR